MGTNRGKVIGIVGSPRRGQNTGTLVQRVLDGAHSEGAETEIFYLSDYQIAPCDACDGCFHFGECVKGDDMRILHMALREARAFVLGTPIYFDHVSAQTKTFLDRLYLYTGPNPELRFPKGVKAVLVATWEARDPQAYDDVVTWLEGRFSYYFGVETVGVLKASNTNAIPVRERADLLQEAFDTGVRLAGLI